MLRNFRIRRVISAATCFLLSGAFVLASNVRTDYDREADFSRYKTYSWGKVKTSNPLDESRLREEVDKRLQADGWEFVPSGGASTIFASTNVRNERQLRTYYEGVGGGWGGGWGWRRWNGFGGGWGPGGFREATTTAENKQLGHVVIDIFESSDHRLLFRGVADHDLGSNSDKNIKGLDKDIDEIIKKLPKSAK